MRCHIPIIFSSFIAFVPSVTEAQCILPHQLTNGQTADANQIMDDLNALLDCINNIKPGGSPNSIQINGGSVLSGVGPLANGQLLVGSTGSSPQPATLSAGLGVSIANGPGTITIAAGSGAVPYSWIRLVLFNNGGGNAFAWNQTAVTDSGGVSPTFSSARSNQVYQGFGPAGTFQNPPVEWSSVDTAVNFVDMQFSSAFLPGTITLTASPDSRIATDAPIDVLVLGSNDGATFYSLGSIHFGPWSASQSQTANIP